MSKQQKTGTDKSEVKMDLSRLDEPFAADDIEWRVQQCGETKDGRPWAMVLAYVTNRAIMKRLDDVCGKENWKNEYLPAPNGGVMCGISINTVDGWVTKWDAAENTQIEAVKGGMSGAMKRAAVQWGIGRYLYDLDESFTECTTENPRNQNWIKAKTKTGKTFWWKIPALPTWALPKTNPATEDKTRTEEQIQNDLEGLPEELKEVRAGLIQLVEEAARLGVESMKELWTSLSTNEVNLIGLDEKKRIYEIAKEVDNNAATAN